jgi:hypothetical protein
MRSKDKIERGKKIILGIINKRNLIPISLLVAFCGISSIPYKDFIQHTVDREHVIDSLRIENMMLKEQLEIACPSNQISTSIRVRKRN